MKSQTLAANLISIIEDFYCERDSTGVDLSAACSTIDTIYLITERYKREEED